MNRRILLLVLVISIVLASGCIANTPPRGCIEDAKICPDGTAVGRVGPDCEFEPCPVSEADSSKNN